ncbi:MAG: hypothetical protein JSS76_19605 [Bacteroidetes bacterium]|nr:hypothetical protein [Bacteroidota bacterium]
MKKLLLLPVFLFVFIAFTTAQSRVDKVLPVIEKRSAGINSATGWIQDNNGKWVSHRNLIATESDPVPDFIKSNRENFEWFHSAKVTYQGKTYYLFYYPRISGEYKYPAIEQDWYTFPEVPFLVYDQANYESLKKAVLAKQSGDIRFTTNIVPAMPPRTADASSILPDIATAIDSHSEFTKAKTFLINIQKDNGKDVVRFTLFKEDGLPELWFTYFEVPYEDFLKIFVD